MSKQIIFIVTIVIFIILIMPIKVQIIRNKEKDEFDKVKNDINLYFFKLINLRFDLDEFIKRITSLKKERVLDIIVNNYLFIKKHKKYLKTLISIIPINKVTIIYYTINPLLGVGMANSIVIIRNIIYDLFEEVNNEYYNVKLSNDNIASVKFEFVCTIRVFYFIYAFIINNIRKLRKGSVFYGKPSNKRFVSNLNG